MARCYSVTMRRRQTSLPAIWLISDERTDAVLEGALLSLPCGSGVIFRHYHLPHAERLARFRALKQLCRRRGHLAVLAGDTATARRAGADGCYGDAALLARGPAMLRLVTAHSLAEIGAALRTRADAILLSPVFPTRSHPGARTLGPLRFHLLAARSRVPVIALGGMNRQRAKRLPGQPWAAIDGHVSDLR
jgi:thiamine-phosphate pyrophosphorylase